MTLTHISVAKNTQVINDVKVNVQYKRDVHK